MEITGAQTISAPRTTVWEALNDPEVLKQCLPGCESVERISAQELKVIILAAIGPLRARFKGNLRFEDVNAPESCTMQFEGQGGAVGFGKGSASVALAEEGGQTQLTYSAQAQVGGKLAQVGSRLIDSVAKKMSDDFFAAFKKQLMPAEALATPVQAVASAPQAAVAEAAATATTAAHAPAAAPANAAPGIAPATQRPVAANYVSGNPASGAAMVPAWWLGVAAVLGAGIAIVAANLI